MSISAHLSPWSRRSVGAARASVMNVSDNLSESSVERERMATLNVTSASAERLTFPPNSRSRSGRVTHFFAFCSLVAGISRFELLAAFVRPIAG